LLAAYNFQEEGKEALAALAGAKEAQDRDGDLAAGRALPDQDRSGREIAGT
jgi:hypothetical protein